MGDVKVFVTKGETGQELLRQSVSELLSRRA